ncbi:MAG: translation initiation factor IF-2 N-terminal domain-containing protein, partial [Candidatus Cloacimonetes bacterium]|nr:translation initiation factor IF-2 N-terminal domain-containing protein [Candidatus Cloacimonadota bacterium]
MQIRVHELAKELKISTMALKKHLTDLGVNIKSHMSFIEGEVADKIRMKYNEQVDAEKRAEKDRKRLMELRMAAKSKPEIPLAKAEPVPEPETIVTEPIFEPVPEEQHVVEEVVPEPLEPVAEPKVEKVLEQDAPKVTIEAPKPIIEPTAD